MAKADIKMPDELLERLSRLGGRTDAVAERVLEAGGEVVLEKVKSKLSAAVGKGTKYKSRSTGELEGAIGLSPVKLDRNGNHNIKIGFSEPHSGGVTNAQLANMLEYGKSGQAARPFLKPAKSASRAACIEAMQRKFQEEVDGG